MSWDSFPSKNKEIVNYINEAGFKGMRIFFNDQYIPYNPSLTEISSVNDWQSFIHHCFETLPRGYNNWDNNSKNWWAGPEVNGKDSETMHDIFKACKANNWLPIVCIGGSEEEVEGAWIPRIVPKDKWGWFGRFCKEFARYLNITYGFVRADLECWNEPNECQGIGMGVHDYASLARIMCTNWKSISPNYKTHIFSCNIREQDYLDYLLTREDLLRVTDYISTHILTDEEWTGYLDGVNYKLANYPIAKKYNIKQTLLEMSPISHGNFDWFESRFNSIRGKVAMYGMLFFTKNEIVHTGDWDEILTYDLQSGTILGIANRPEEPKFSFIKYFNREVYNMYEDEKNYNIPMDMATFADAIGLPKKGNYSPYLPILSAYFFGNTGYTHKPEQLLSKKDFDPWVEGMLNLLAKVNGKTNRVNVWYDANGNYRTEAQRLAVTKSNPK